jgi:hypothetical protein
MWDDLLYQQRSHLQYATITILHIGGPKHSDPICTIFRDHDGKVTPEEVAAAAAYLKDTIGKEGVQELISNLSKDTGSFTYMLPQCCLCPIFLYFSERSLYALLQKEKSLLKIL